MNAITDVAVARVALRNLCVVDYTNGFTLWHYRSSLPLATVLSPGFFDDARAGHINAGDHILVSAADGGGSLYVKATGMLVMSATGATMSDSAILFEQIDADTGEYWSVDDGGGLLTMHYVADYTAPMVSIPLPPHILRVMSDASGGTPIADSRQRVIPFRRVA